MGLGFGGAGPDRRPADQIGHILRRDRVQHLGGGGQAHFVDLRQQAARFAQSGRHVAGTVQVRIIDQPFPAHGSARFFKINPHNHKKGVGHLFAQRIQTVCILDGRLLVMDRTRPHNCQQAALLFTQYAFDGLSSGNHRFFRPGADRNFIF